MEEEHIFGIFIGFHIWGAYIFSWGAYMRGVGTGFYGIQIKD